MPILACLFVGKCVPWSHMEVTNASARTTASAFSVSARLQMMSPMLSLSVSPLAISICAAAPEALPARGMGDSTCCPKQLPKSLTCTVRQAWPNTGCQIDGSAKYGMEDAAYSLCQ